MAVIALFACSLTGLAAIGSLAVTRLSYVGAAGFLVAVVAVGAVIVRAETLPEDELPQGPRVLDAIAILLSSGRPFVLVPADARVPIEASDTFSTVHDDQADLAIRVVETCSMRSVGRLSYPIRRPGPRGKPQIKVTMTVDAAGHIELAITEAGGTAVTRYRGLAARLTTDTPFN